MKSPNSAAVPGISIAMDSRLENGIEMSAELRLRVCTYLNLSAALLYALIDYIEHFGVSTYNVYLPFVTLSMLWHHLLLLLLLAVNCMLYLHIVKI